VPVFAAAVAAAAAAAAAAVPMSLSAPARTNSRALSDNSRLIVSDAVEVPVDLRSSFSKLISPAMYKTELRRHVEHVRWYLEHPTEARGLSQSKNDIIRKVRACIEHDDMFEQRDSSSK